MISSVQDVTLIYTTMLNSLSGKDF